MPRAITNLTATALLLCNATGTTNSLLLAAADTISKELFIQLVSAVSIILLAVV